MAEDRIELLAVVVAQLQTTLNRADRAMADVLAVGSAEDLQVLRLLLATVSRNANSCCASEHQGIGERSWSDSRPGVGGWRRRVERHG
jgi:hypothetical protein